MLPQTLMLFFPLLVAVSVYPRARINEQAGKFSTLALIFACCAVSAGVFVNRSLEDPRPWLAIAQMGSFLLTLYFSARIIRMAGLRWYDGLVALYGVAAIALGAMT